MIILLENFGRKANWVAIYMDKEKKISLYIEGGKAGNRDLNSKLRRAFDTIFRAYFGDSYKKIKIHACGSRGDAFLDFIRSIKQENISFLLIDSEENVDVADFQQRQKFVNKIFSNHIGKFSSINIKNIFFMIVNTESWILTDKNNIKDFFCKDFKIDKLPKGKDCEKISKEAIYEGFEQATKECKKKLTKHNVFEILEKTRIDNLLCHGKEIRFFFEALKETIQNIEKQEK